MSDDINFLIHTNAANAFRQGRITEQNRIIKLIEKAVEGERKLLSLTKDRTDFKNRFYKISIANSFIDLIKGEDE